MFNDIEIRLGSIYRIQFDNLKVVYGYIYGEEEDGVYKACAVSPSQVPRNKDDVEFGDIVVHPWAIFPILDIMCVERVCELPMSHIEEIFHKIHGNIEHIPMNDSLFKYRESVLYGIMGYATRVIGFAMMGEHTSHLRCH